MFDGGNKYNLLALNGTRLVSLTPHVTLKLLKCTGFPITVHLPQNILYYWFFLLFGCCTSYQKGAFYFVSLIFLCLKSVIYRFNFPFSCIFFLPFSFLVKFLSQLLALYYTTLYVFFFGSTNLTNAMKFWKSSHNYVNWFSFYLVIFFRLFTD